MTTWLEGPFAKYAADVNRIVDEQWYGASIPPSQTGLIRRVIYQCATGERGGVEAYWQVQIGNTWWGVRPKSIIDRGFLNLACGRTETVEIPEGPSIHAKAPWELPRDKWSHWTKAKACAWMAFCKGLATLGNRDAGEHREVFERWWLNYGARDAGEA